MSPGSQQTRTWGSLWRGSRELLKNEWILARHRLAGSGIGITTNEQRLLSLRNAHRGRRIWVIGNGPSLRLEDLSCLQNEVTIASNGIFLLFDRTEFRPTYYTVEDVLVAEDRASEINAMEGPTKVFPHDVSRWLRTGPRGAYVNFLRYYEGFPRFTDGFPRKVYWGGTVTYLNLQLAHYLGASEICLIGVDHSYKEPKPADEQAGHVITSRTADENHFDPNYFGPGFRWHDPQLDRMEASYRQAKTFLERQGVRVLNATRGGHLEVFPRANLDEILPSRVGKVANSG